MSRTTGFTCICTCFTTSSDLGSIFLSSIYLSALFLFKCISHCLSFYLSITYPSLWVFFFCPPLSTSSSASHFLCPSIFAVMALAVWTEGVIQVRGTAEPVINLIHRSITISFLSCMCVWCLCVFVYMCIHEISRIVMEHTETPVLPQCTFIS